MDIDGQPHARNPLTFLLEAADDIAYVASDVEDSIEKNTISIHQLLGWMKDKINGLPEEGEELHQLRRLTVEGIHNNLTKRIDACNGEPRYEMMQFQNWTNYLRNWLMYVACCSFVNNGESIMNGSFEGELLEDSMHKYTIDILKSEMVANVYPNLGRIHIAAHNILTNILDCFVPAVMNWDSKEDSNLIYDSYINMIPKGYRDAYIQERGDDDAENLYLRFRMLIDFVSNLTDTSALDLYKLINAMNY